MAEDWTMPKGELMKGKRGVVMGVANDHSIAWGISKQLALQGAELAFTYQGDALAKRVRPLVESIGQKLMVPADVTDDASMDTAFATIKETWGSIDFLVHAIAFASRDALTYPYYETSRADFLQAMEISVYSLVALCQHALPHLAHGACILTLTYLGSVRMVPGYNVMGVCKAALESSVRYLAAELGRAKNVRVNALSAGPLRTLSSAGVTGFSKILDHYPTKAPLARNVEGGEVGKSGLYLLSDLSSGVTGEVHYVDAGYSIIGW